MKYETRKIFFDINSDRARIHCASAFFKEETITISRAEATGNMDAKLFNMRLMKPK